MRIVILGAGYVGLVSGACFADFGHHVTCIDKDAEKIAALQRGAIAWAHAQSTVVRARWFLAECGLEAPAP